MLGQQHMPVVVKVADDGNDNAALAEPFYDVRNRSRGLTSVHGHPHKLRAGASELFDLERGAFDVHGVGVGHRLDYDGVLRADFDAVYVDYY
jgi:hypothetical protein